MILLKMDIILWLVPAKKWLYINIYGPQRDSIFQLYFPLTNMAENKA